MIGYLTQDWLETGDVSFLEAATKLLAHTSGMPATSDQPALILLRFFGLSLAIPSRITGDPLRALETMNLSADRALYLQKDILCMSLTPNTTQRFFVDRDRQFFVDRVLGKTIYSDTLAVLLGILMERPGIHFEEIMFLCFGISPYQAWLHDTKIYNFIYRLRKETASQLCIKTKNRRVFLTAGENEIFLQPSCLSWRQCQQVNIQFSDASFKERDLETAIERILQTHHSVTREAIQNELQISKSTAQRNLNRLIAQQKIIKQGIGKSSTYRSWAVSPSIQNSIQEREIKKSSDNQCDLKKEDGGRNEF